MAKYQKPQNRAHKGFFYLNDEILINSLSALESGKIDEIVSKTTTAREGGGNGGVRAKIAVAEVEAGGGRKSSSAVEEEMVRTRTRFSVFDAWYNHLQKADAIGHFVGWGPEILDEVETGDTIEFRADLSLGSLQTVFRLYIWFADQAERQNSPFAQKGDELKATKRNRQMLKAIMGQGADGDDDLPLIAVPLGDAGPGVVMIADRKWMIGKLGKLGGDFGIVAQVSRVVPLGEEYPILRLTKDVTPTPIEIKTLKDIVEGFVEPAKSLGVSVNSSDSVVVGPALIIDPIAIYR